MKLSLRKYLILFAFVTLFVGIESHAWSIFSRQGNNRCEILVSNLGTSSRLRNLVKESMTVVNNRFWKVEDQVYISESDKRIRRAIVDDSLSPGERDLILSDWLVKIERNLLGGERVDTYQHLTLVYLYRSNFLLSMNEEMRNEISERLDNSLSLSWNLLYGEEKTASEVADLRLKYQSLKNLSERELALHNAVFRNMNERPSLVSTFRDYVFRWTDLVYVFGVGAIAFSTVGLPAIASFLRGYFVGITTEYIGHRYFNHVDGSRLSRWLKKFGGIRRMMRRSIFSHSRVHHSGTYRDSYRVQFESEEEKQRMVGKIEGNPEVDSHRIIDKRIFGLIMDDEDIITLAVPAGLLSLVTSFVFGASTGEYFTSLFGASVFLFHLNFVHKIMHFDEEVMGRKMTPFENWFMHTRYFRLINRHHFVHHEIPTANFNVMIGIDRLMNTLRQPDFNTLLRMEEMESIF